MTSLRAALIYLARVFKSLSLSTENSLRLSYLREQGEFCRKNKQKDSEYRHTKLYTFRQKGMDNPLPALVKLLGLLVLHVITLAVAEPLAVLRTPGERRLEQ